VRRRRVLQVKDNAVPRSHRRRYASRAYLIVSVFVYLGLGDLAARWLPNGRFIAYVSIVFAVHTAAYLLITEARDYADNKRS
jgi:hypothetical protein